jgi:hypothetical protein
MRYQYLCGLIALRVGLVESGLLLQREITWAVSLDFVYELRAELLQYLVGKLPIPFLRKRLGQCLARNFRPSKTSYYWTKFERVVLRSGLCETDAQISNDI